ncbi:hypothetical protein GWK08_01280 [Leptobacterium flavescens]|uniref:Baseplate protein J-like domain-containing protein n=1 Tax=Leptobacterium flavescens TaxID=472055 RepID=A0A6P0UHY4_9FLAO|nr:hypothetical protein [Leptobacterium flavescens]NER12060.1 hypothetical protein [Leptobacterium flavescens]
MKKPSHISHPLKNRKGTSQKTRIISALSPDSAPIDGKTLADRLFLISSYARQINFYEYRKNDRDGEYQELSHWLPFFRNSLPFQLAELSKTSADALEEQFLLLISELNANPSKQSLESVMIFILNKIISPTALLSRTIEEAENSFSIPLNAIVKSAFIEALKSYISLYNASATFLCLEKKNFSDYMKAPWQLKVQEVFALDPCIKHSKKGKKEAFLKAADVLNTLFAQMLKGFREIITASPQYIEESLLPLKESLQKRHQPHLALLFSFLELFNHLQGNINDLGKKHLDFFYERVLKMIPKDAVPDKAHLIFEMAKHLDEYPLPEGLLLKNGKDVNKEDIQFALDHEIVLDKAQVKELKTLSLYDVRDNGNSYIEGVYTAPVANSADGLGKAFKKDQSQNWSSLGSKYSKYIEEGKTIANEHPKARLGFVISSPVLLLEEGKRTITIRLNCQLPQNSSHTTLEIKNELESLVTQPIYHLTDDLIDNCAASLSPEAKQFLRDFLSKESPYLIEDLKKFLSVEDPVSCEPVFSEVEKRTLCNCLQLSSTTLSEPIFNISFSGEKDWVIPKPGNITDIKINLPAFPELATDGDLQFEIKVVLEEDDPMVVFYDEKQLKEKIPLKKPFPLVKIEANTGINIKKNIFGCDDLSAPPPPGDPNRCCLKKEKRSEEEINVSLYHFLKGLTLVDSRIDVEVCEVKNLIVQNDENLQDVNKPVFPFGPRPKVDSAFYIGSREVFCKNWESFRLNVKWKDRPADFSTYYEAYNQNPPPTIDDSSFSVKGSVLESGNWEEDGTKEMFTPQETFPGCPDIDGVTYDNGYTWQRADFGASAANYVVKSMPVDPLVPLNVNSRKAFFRLQLKGEDFQHDRYAFVLAQQMFKLADVADLIKSAGFITQVDQSCTLATLNEDQITDLINEVDAQGGSGGTINNLIMAFLKGRIFPPPIIRGLNNISDELQSKVCALKTLIENITGGVDVVLPNEPYTPLIKSLSVDYKAHATREDMDIVHLYPFENTSKFEDIEKSPTLFPFLNDEGTLFIGMEDIQPGGNLSLLFQLAEATADSERDRAKINWHYLKNNEWILLKPHLDVISDHTDGLTVSGIVTIALPDTFSKTGSTLMPDNLYWIKASAEENVQAVAEIIGVHSQAARASAHMSELNDKNRLDTALEAGSISKLVEGDFSVKKVEQLYDSFEGRKPEAEGHFYIRVSEHLKHKGRGIMIGDHEKITLEGFPQIYKVKCISHTMGLSANEYRRDLEVAPGYMVICVIPDLSKLKSGDQLKPKVPLSILEKIGDHIRSKTSPFARIKVMNPRYEEVNVSVSVRLHRGKPDAFYAKKLKEDITLFLAPWATGSSEDINFGQEVLFSDLVGFIEQLDYVDFIVNLELEGECDQKGAVIKPLTARSVLTGGKICVNINKEKCPEPTNEQVELI